MIVECDFCQTRFRFDPENIKGEKTKVRCSRCGNVFEVLKPEKDQEDERDFVAPFIPNEKPVIKKQKSVPPQVTLTGRVSHPKLKKRRKISRNPLVWVILLAVLGGAFFLYYEGDIPFLKESPKKNTETKRVSVTIDDKDSMQAYFIENTHAGQLFVIQGESINNSSVPVSFILLEGKTYDINSKIAQSQKCYAGNLIAREELRTLTASEIEKRMMTREGKDLVNVNIAPNGRVPFMIVYHDMPSLETLVNYSVEVVDFKVD